MGQTAENCIVLPVGSNKPSMEVSVNNGVVTELNIFPSGLGLTPHQVIEALSSAGIHIDRIAFLVPTEVPLDTINGLNPGIRTASDGSLRHVAQRVGEQMQNVLYLNH